ncbi:MAG TPA: tetratricopeptide repeat protein, partial [Rhizomicrobium sp.]|nr:tetratricopeptide repeat protein [Rhizomicrobium sp.]
MVTLQADPGLRQSLLLADQLLRAGQPEAANRLLAPLRHHFAADPKLLHLSGLIAMHQQRYAEAADVFERARTAEPREAVLAFSHATALRWLERHDQAAQAFRDAAALKPDYAEAYYEAGTILQQLGALE